MQSEYLLNYADYKNKIFYLEEYLYEVGSQDAAKAHQAYLHILDVARKKGFKVLGVWRNPEDPKSVVTFDIKESNIGETKYFMER